MSKINNRTERKEHLLNILNVAFGFLVILFLLAYFMAHYYLIIIFLLEGKFNFITTMDLYYIIHTIVLSLIIFPLFILFLTKAFKNLKIHIYSDNKELEG